MRSAATFLLAFLVGGCAATARELRPGDLAPAFRLVQTDGRTFDLAERAGHWTVLYFYPRDGTPGCTRQACAFRDAIAAIRERGCEVFGLSTDSVLSHRRFTREQDLSFQLLADEDARVAHLYGANGILGFDKRWTFLLGPDLRLRWIEHDVDPALDAARIVAQLDALGVLPPTTAGAGAGAR